MTFRGVSPTVGPQRVFGGQVAGQALVAAGRTVDPERKVHSLHGYFVRAGDPTEPIVYAVEDIRDGRSFSVRRTVANQHDRPIFFMSASFHRPEPGLDHYAPGPSNVPPPDVVFPAIFRGTLRFLRVISKSPADEALDLCCGTGIGALVLSRHVRRAVASDITGRATQFARFNRLLNGCENVEVVQGDLYEPVEGRMFDRVIAHPPYVPALSETHVFRDAGETGEGVLERIVAGLPRHLRPGGTFYCLSAGWDTAEGPFETRIRGWLGDHSPEFDLILAQQEEMSPSQVVRWLSDKSAGGDGVREAFEKRFTAAALERNVYGAIVLHRVV